MTPTIETGAALPAFQPGDEVMVRGVINPRSSRTVRFLCDGKTYGLVVDLDQIHPLPTAPAHLRAAAEVFRSNNFDGHAACCERLASHLESTSAPKPPPTLREALENVRALIAEGAEHGFNPHGSDWADRLFRSQQMTTQALAREGAAP